MPTGVFDEFILYDDEDEWLWPKIRFELMFTSHGGSGLGLTFEDCENLDYADIGDLYHRLVERQRAEARAIESAYKKKTPV